MDWRSLFVWQSAMPKLYTTSISESIGETAMKQLVIFCSVALLATNALWGQTVVLSEAFDTAFPTNWTQRSDDGVQWKFQSDLGTYATGCAIADQSQDSERKNGWLQTPFVDLTTVQNPTMSFKAAVVQNNFVQPNISLWYDNGNGWQLLRRWGTTHFGADVDIEAGTDMAAPLDAENVHWVDITYSLASLVSNKHIRFAFGADFVNGGWVLLDKVVVSGESVTSVGEPEQEIEGIPHVYPNPTTEKLFVDNGGTIESVEVLDVQGQKVQIGIILQKTEAGMEIDIQSLAKGTYFLHIRTTMEKKRTFVKKFVVL